MNYRGLAPKKMLIYVTILGGLFFFNESEVFGEELLSNFSEEEIIVEKELTVIEEENLEVEVKEELVEEENTNEEIILENEEQLDLDETLELEENFEEENIEVEDNDDVLVEEEIEIEEEQEKSEEDVVVETFDKIAIFNEYSTNMEFVEDTVTIKLGLDKEANVLSILEFIDRDSLKNTYKVERIGITNEEDIWLESIDEVTNLCHLVFVGSNFISRYEIKFFGDINQDNSINEEDIGIGVDIFLTNENEVNKESSLTEEVSYADAVVGKNTDEVSVPVEEELVSNITLGNKEDIYVGDEIIIQYNVDGLENNYVNTISGNIEYNKEILSLDNIYVVVDGEVTGGFYNNRFIYVLDNYQSSEPFLIMVFKTIKEGNSFISLDDLKVAMNGSLLNIVGDNSLEIIVQEYPKGGDIEDNTNNSVNVIKPVVIDKKPVIKPTVYYNKEESNQVVTTVVLSNDNYIKELNIKGYKLDFDKEVSQYVIEVDENVSNLELNVLLNHDNSSYFITGNENFKEGKNQIILTVFAENGSSRDYVIEVNKKSTKKDKNIIDAEVNEELEEENDSEDKGVKKITLLVILVILIVTVIAIIFKLLSDED